MDSMCISLLLSLPLFLSLSLHYFLPLFFSSDPGPLRQSQRTQDAFQQDLVPGTAAGLEVFTQKSLAASPEVTVFTFLCPFLPGLLHTLIYPLGS